MNTTRRLQPLFFCATLVVLAAVASALPAIAQSDVGKVPNVAVWNEADGKVSLPEELRRTRGGPVILLPVYTRCAASCPILTQKLEQEIARMDSGSAYRVVLLSFDAAETAESLRAFRERERVPAQWVLLRADGAEIRRIFDFFNYPVMTEAGVLVHPNKIFLLDHELNWRSTLTGEDWSSVDLQRSLRQIEAPGLLGWVAMNPAKLVFIGFGGLLVSLALLIGWQMSRRADIPL